LLLCGAGEDGHTLEISYDQVQQMATRLVNYDEIASTYDQRYSAHHYDGIGTTLLSLTRQVGAEHVLEVGCGTCHWLVELQPAAQWVYGLDLSLSMLQQARQRKEDFPLICGRASQLSFADAAFDLIFCVNAFHHFRRPDGFIREARRLLKAGGALAIIGMDPHEGRDRWYIYDYFAGTYETDLSRFPSGETISQWMIAAGFDKVERGLAERIVHTHVGQEVLQSPIVQKHGTSQLALLTEEAYAAGIGRIEAALRQAGAKRERIEFPVDISLTIVTGYVHKLF
jgi:ubiquinone/menaquinone biosynthesis C-methylase UbiE